MYQPTAKVLAVLEFLQARWRMSGRELALRVASSGPARPLGERFFTPPAEEIDIPNYSRLERVPC